MKNFIENTVREAGVVALEKFRSVGVAYTKANENDVVTEADVAINDLLVERIGAAYPEHGIITEEADAKNKDAEYVWIADPIDGTLNFSKGVPIFGIMLAVSRKGDITHGAIFDPVHDELLYAQKSNGVTLNGKPVCCSRRKEWKNSVGHLPSFIAMPQDGGTLFHLRMQLLRNLLDQAQDSGLYAYELGSVAISSLYTAIGKRDWYVSIGGYDWDYAAAKVALEEAGCVVSDFWGKPWKLGERTFVAANSDLHKILIEIINR